MVKNRHYRAQSKSRTPRWIALAALVILVVIVGGGYLVHHRPKDSASVAGIGAPVSAAMMKDLTAIPSSVWKGLGTKGAVAAQLTPNKPTPSFLYIGAEGCPYCAAERWPIVVALSRFGHFSGLTLMRSNGQDSYPNTPTVDFLHARFRSPYFTAHLMEILGRKLGPQGFYPPLMKLTAAEDHAFATYDAPPYVPQGYSESFPFVLVGSRYVWIGSSVYPALLAHKSWNAVSRAIRSGKGPIAQSVLANANALTAAICKVDGNRPSAVCNQVGGHVPTQATP